MDDRLDKEVSDEQKQQELEEAMELLKEVMHGDFPVGMLRVYYDKFATHCIASVMDVENHPDTKQVRPLFIQVTDDMAPYITDAAGNHLIRKLDS